MANKNIIVLSNVKKQKIKCYGQVICQHYLKKVLTIENETDYYSNPGLNPDIKRNGYILSFFTVGHNATSVSKYSTVLY